MKKDNEPTPSWYRELEETPFDKPQWSTERQRELREQIHHKDRRRIGRRHWLWQASVGACLMVFMITGILWLAIIQPDGHSGQSSVTNSQPLAAPVVTWEVFPGGEAQVSTRGARWNIHRTMTELRGKEIRITATHEDTGFTFEELPRTKIDETTAIDYSLFSAISSDATTTSSFFAEYPMFGAPQHNRGTALVSEMIVPLPGTWRYDLYLDDLHQGSKVLEIEGADWTPSSTFQSGTYTLEGIEGQLGLLNGGFRAGQAQKHMWHFWGTDQEVTGDVDVYAVQVDTLRLEHILQGDPLEPGPLNGADAVLHCHMTIPDPGQWTLLVTVNDRLVGAVPVEVEPAEE